MKCDLKEIRHDTDGDEYYHQCQRDRVRVYASPLGRLGLCEPCLMVVRSQADSVAQAIRRKDGERVTLPNGTKGRRPVEARLFFRRGNIVVRNLPTDQDGADAKSAMESEVKAQRSKS